MTRPVSVLFSVLLLSFCIARPAAADVVRGRVADPQDRAIARATVLIVQGSTVVTSLVTRTDGLFGPLTMSPGEYDVIVSAPGFRVAPKRITVAATGDISVDIKLALAAVSDSLVVSASQVDRPLSRVTDSVTVIDRADLDARRMETAAEALRLVPGFGVVNNGTRGALTSAFPRGGESDYTLVLVDGIPVNAFGGGFDFAHLPVSGIERIEVVRGPQSAVFGSGAIGGIVNIVTRKGGAPQGALTIEGGQQGTTRFAGEASGGRGAWSWGGAIERYASDGDTSFRPSIGANVTNDDYERVAASAGLGWSDRATRRLRVDFRMGVDERGNPGPYGSDPFDIYSQIEQSRQRNEPIGVAAAGVFGSLQSIRHSAQFAWSDTASTFTTIFGTSEDRTRRTLGRYQADLERGGIGFSTGVELIKERADNTFVTDPAFTPIPVDRTLTGLFAEGRWDGSSRFAVTAGLRAERIERAALVADPFGSRPDLPADVVWSVNPKVSAVWFLRGDRSGAMGWTKVRGGAGTGIKPPTVFELGFTDNPSLRPERSRSFDVGIEHAFASRALVVEATGFFNEYDDLIVAVGLSANPASQFRTDNIANARAAGLELSGRWHFANGLSLNGTHTFLHTRVLSVDSVTGVAPAPYVVGDWLIRRPRHSFSADVRFERGRLQLFLAMHGRSKMLDVEPNIGAPTFLVASNQVFAAGGSYRVHRWFDVYARVTNLLDREYEDALGFPAQARSALVGLRVTVGR